MKHLLPTTILKLKSVRPQVWTTTVHDKLYGPIEAMSTLEAKIKFLRSLSLFSHVESSMKIDVILSIDLIQTWPLFGMTFFTAQVC